MTAVKSELKASDVMAREPVCVEPSMTIRQLTRVFDENDISGAPVIDKEGRVIGVVTRTDLIRRCAEGAIDVPATYLFEVLCQQGDEDEQVIPEAIICVQDLMTQDPVTVSPETSAGAVARLMFNEHIHRVVVTDGSRFPVGIITSLDLLGTYSR